MKKVIVLASFMASALSLFAYGYYDYDTPAWLIFFLIVSIITAILQGILFFKIWNMTNDVKHLKKIISREIDCDIDSEMSYEDLCIKVRKLYFNGFEEKAYNLLNAALFNLLSRKMISTLKRDEKFVVGVWDSNAPGGYKYIEINELIQQVLSKYEYIYGLIGREIPQNIKRITYDKFRAFLIAEPIKGANTL
ncbi:MAG: hypothetical protein ACI31C_09065 [Muribaculaceae bacterium]